MISPDLLCLKNVSNTLDFNSESLKTARLPRQFLRKQRVTHAMQAASSECRKSIRSFSLLLQPRQLPSQLLQELERVLHVPRHRRSNLQAVFQDILFEVVNSSIDE